LAGELLLFYFVGFISGFIVDGKREWHARIGRSMI
jgi:hypothetical protein